MSGIYTQLDQDEWTELENRHVADSGNIYAGKGYKQGFEVKVFVRPVTSKT